MDFFVADDHAHVRYARGGYVSSCGWDYPREAIIWVGEYAPEAYEKCSECQTQAVANAPEIERIVSQGVYAIGDDAHLWTVRSRTAWHSVCGRKDADLEVAWAASEWPEAYEACGQCISLVDEDLWRPDAAIEVEPPGSSNPHRHLAYRVWVIQDGTQHRSSDNERAAAMCGQALRPGVLPRDYQTDGTLPCHACDRAVGRARAGLPPLPLSSLLLPPEPTSAVAPPAGQHVKLPKRSQRQPKAARGSRAKRSVAASVATSQFGGSGCGSDVALFGRKMIVPVRFVRGGAPGLGRRR